MPWPACPLTPMLPGVPTGEPPPSNVPPWSPVTDTPDGAPAPADGCWPVGAAPPALTDPPVAAAGSAAAIVAPCAAPRIACCICGVHITRSTLGAVGSAGHRRRQAVLHPSVSCHRIRQRQAVERALCRERLSHAGLVLSGLAAALPVIAAVKAMKSTLAAAPLQGRQCTVPQI